MWLVKPLLYFPNRPMRHILPVLQLHDVNNPHTKRLANLRLPHERRFQRTGECFVGDDGISFGIHGVDIQFEPVDITKPGVDKCFEGVFVVGETCGSSMVNEIRMYNFIQRSHIRAEEAGFIESSYHGFVLFEDVLHSKNYLLQN